ncbi:MAG: symmetrical bis(5'-nucleosyl)-tetraphosphatase [Pseudomonadota bacterium]
MTSYAIGDLQGCHQQTQMLLEQIDAASPQARIFFVGDLVNRGPQSLRTLRLVHGMGAKAESVLGNHDLNLLAVANGVRKQGKSDTLTEILTAADRVQLLGWLRRRPLAILENGHLLVHAGVLPQWSAEQTLALAKEVETVLQGPDWVDFLREMYGNTPVRWDDRLRGVERLRCIVNALTRMRFCHSDGSMALEDKAGGTVANHLPWFDLPGRKTEDVTVVFGHWSACGLVQRANLIGLDTGCVWGGKLTAVQLEDRSLLQVACPQYQKPG